ncbi:MAG TPA: YvcK family protein [Thermodesulfobacteriota bacterium]|nr:YvcK family protein [Thermodesulfobacteriota bacterium]HOC38148.1 YvcK family protein [Thermodesulfobacteriota bacterium]HQO78322.1 YvcK family protein [Thermodesulfobacteriota bacterium]
MSTSPHIVSVGSISTASLLIDGLKDCGPYLTAVVPTTDTGSSTGLIRERFGMPAPGDVRAVLSAFAAVEDGQCRLLRDLFEYRLPVDRVPEMNSMALGNLILAGLAQMTGDLSQAVKEAAKLLRTRGTVLPVTAESAQLKAILEDGQEVIGEHLVRRVGKPRIRSVSLDRDDIALGRGIAEAVAAADLIVIGPGCLITSLVACLVVPGLVESINTAKAPAVYCCNTTTTPGQTDGMTVADHVATIACYLGAVSPDYVLINNRPPVSQAVDAYRDDGIQVLMPSAEEIKSIASQGSSTIVADLIEEQWTGKRKLHKLDSVRHDPIKVGKVLMKILHEEIGPGA